jgi:hypothetical protein
MTTDQATGTRPLAVVLGQVDVPLQRAAEAAAQAGFTVYVPPLGANLRSDPAAQQALAALCSQNMDQTQVLSLYMQLRQRPAFILTSLQGALLVSGFDNSPPGPYPPAALTGMLKLHLRRRFPQIADLENTESEQAAEPPPARVVEPAPRVVEPAPRVVEPPPARVVEPPPARVVEPPPARVVEPPSDRVIETPSAYAADAASRAARPATPVVTRPLQQRTTPVGERSSAETAPPARSAPLSRTFARAAIAAGAVLIIIAVFAIRSLLLGDTETLPTAQATAVPAVPTTAPAIPTAAPAIPTAAAAAPLLLVEIVAVEPVSPQVGEPVNFRLRVRNIGAVATQGPFWVDLYIDPERTPQIGDTWDSVAAAGATWEVAALRPGEVRELTTLEADPARSNFVSFSDVGVRQIYIQVDTYGEAAIGAEQGPAILLGPQEVTVGNATSQP